MKIYLVGGAVRDKLLGIRIIDRDWVVVGSTYKEMIDFGFIPVGNSFPVFIHPITKEEYALARKEKKKGKGYKGFTCYFSKYITLKEDLYRRDITINAIALDSSGKYYDPFGGINDLNNRIIRHVSKFFMDDPLRVLRVAKFYSRFYKFNFHISDKTLVFMKNISNSNELLYLSPERIWLETKEIIKNYNLFFYFYILNKCNALKKIYPELFQLYFNKKFLNYFILLSNYLLINKFNIKINFICLCFFFNDTILSSNFFIYNKYIINSVFFFCKRLCIPKKFFNFYKIIYKCLKKIFFYKKKNITNLFLYILYTLNVWRNNSNIYFFLNIINILNIFPLVFNKNIFFLIKKYILDIFYITKNIKNKYLINLGFSGIEISKKLFYFRYKKIYFFLKKINLY